jgi:hypothetical protein
VPQRQGDQEGVTSEEMAAEVVGVRARLAAFHREWEQARQELRRGGPPAVRGADDGFHVLARAMRAKHPGIVFAHAAATGEVDPLTDLESRLFVGLPVQRNA